jgi:hypothetical protein
MSNLLEHARREMRAAGLYDADADYGGAIGPAVERMVENFDAEGHSGYSASLALSIFAKVAAFEPLGPLTGADDEWTEVSRGMWQNKRCSHVFKGEDGRAYDINGRVFRESSGACYTNSESRVYVEFPYTPHTEYVQVAAPDDPADS